MVNTIAANTVGVILSALYITVCCIVSRRRSNADVGINNGTLQLIQPTLNADTREDVNHFEIPEGNDFFIDTKHFRTNDVLAKDIMLLYTCELQE